MSISSMYNTSNLDVPFYSHFVIKITFLKDGGIDNSNLLLNSDD